jgi:transglutaminase-like putative cysteine protease
MRSATLRILLGLAAALLLAGCLRAAGHLNGTATAPVDPVEAPSGGRASAEAVVTPPPAATPTPVPDFVTYQVVERMRVVNRGPGEPAKQNLWIALISDVPPYQRVEATVVTPGGYEAITDEYGNRYAEFDLSNQAAGSTVPIELRYHVTVRRVVRDLGDCQGELPATYTRPELHVESANPQIVELSRQMSQGAGTACQQVRSFYDYTANNLTYTFNGQNWGAQAALGQMGADCTEYSSLMMALSRAAGIPARYLEGLAYLPGDGDELARTEHAWLEVYLPGNGWTPMDPTMGRSSMTRERYFAAMTPDHIIVTRGRNPSTLRGASYWTHLYWPGDSTDIKIEDFQWEIHPINP